MKYFELNSIHLSADELETLQEFMERVDSDMTESVFKSACGE
jgi:succinate dehydrogenase flavin-adding protein (antitoxin of CptAB toxin-antitoxin module)